MAERKIARVEKPQAAAKKRKKQSKSGKEGARLAVIRLRGGISVRFGIKKTLENLRLYRKNYCVVLENTPARRGMLQKAKDFITWGEIDDETYNLLVEKRGEEYAGRTEDYHKRKYIEVKGKKLKPYFRLSPPAGGFRRRGIKKPYSVGGDAGYRGEEINELIRRMVG